MPRKMTYRFNATITLRVNVIGVTIRLLKYTNSTTANLKLKVWFVWLRYVTTAKANTSFN